MCYLCDTSRDCRFLSSSYPQYPQYPHLFETPDSQGLARGVGLAFLEKCATIHLPYKILVPPNIGITLRNLEQDR